MRTNGWLVLLATVVVSAALGFCPSGPAAAAPPRIRCGATITRSVRLMADLGGCGHRGLIIGAAGVTVDLGGHTISGTNRPGSEGISSDGHRRVTVRNGTVRGFFVNGVALRNAPQSAVRQVAVGRIGAGGVEDQFSAGIYLADAPESTIDHNVVTNDVPAWEADGVVIRNSPRVRVVGNRFARNSWDGLFVVSSPDAQIVANRFDRNANNGMEAKSSDSIAVRCNRAYRNANVGIAIGILRGAHIDGNVADSNGAVGADRTGIFLFDLEDSLVVDNVATRNGDGIVLHNDQAASRRNLLVDNVANRNQRFGLLIDGGDLGGPGPERNVVVSNLAQRNAIGIVVLGSSGNDLIRNRATHNNADGVLIGAAGNRLAGTVADFNGGIGIRSVGGTIDGGDNSARGNGSTPQCIGVRCAGGSRSAASATCSGDVCSAQISDRDRTGPYGFVRKA